MMDSQDKISKRKNYSRLLVVAHLRPFLQVGAARTIHSLLASSARASRRRAWLAWKSAVADTAAAERLQNLQRLALQRCVRSRRLRDTGAAWATLHSAVRQSRGLVTGAARLDAVLFRARRRTLSRRLGAWRSESLARAVAAGAHHAVRDRRLAATRLLGSAASRVKRRRLEIGWRAMEGVAADGRRAEAAAEARAERVGVVARVAAERVRRRALTRAWAAWKEALARRRVRSAVTAATSSLAGETVALARQVHLLRLGGALRLMASAAERSNRYVSR